MDKKLRQRGPNFTANDNMLLAEIVDRYKHVIENKRTDGATVQQKQQAWLNVVKEFNSITSGHTRTLESLQQNYKNLKRKLKKSESNAKMAIPVDRNILVSSIEEHGTTEGWEQVAQETGVPQEICIKSFNDMVKQVEINEIKFKKEVKQTGGGPPPDDENADPVLCKIKALVGPSIDGIYTIYDGDRPLMEIQNKTPIEIKNTHVSDLEITPTMRDTTCKKNLSALLIDEDCSEPTPAPGTSTDNGYFDNNRANLKRKPHQLLSRKRTMQEPKEKKNVTENFQELAKRKIELVNIQKEIFSMQVIDMEETLAHNRQLRAMELEETKKKNEHNEMLRKLELAKLNK